MFKLYIFMVVSILLSNPAEATVFVQADQQDVARIDLNLDQSFVLDFDLEAESSRSWSREFRFETEFDGNLMIWFEVEGASPVLSARVLGSKEETLEAALDRDGLKTISMPVSRGDEGAITLGIEKLVSNVRARVSVFRIVETADTYRAFRSGQAEVQAIAEQVRAGEFAKARDALRALTRELLATPGMAESVRIAQVLMDCSNLAGSCHDPMLQIEIDETVFEFTSRIMVPGSLRLNTFRRNLALALLAEGDHLRLLDIRKRVWDTSCRYLAESDPVRIFDEVDYAQALKYTGQLSEALEIEKRCLARLESVPGIEPRKILALRANISDSLYLLGDLSSAKELSNLVDHELKTLFGDELDNSNVAQYVGNLEDSARILVAMGMYWRAIPHLEEAYDLRLQFQSAQHPDALKIKGSLASAFRGARNYNAARRLGREILADTIQAFDEDHEQTQWARLDLAATLGALDKTDEAAKLLEIVRRYLEANPNLRADARWAVQVSLGSNYYAMGRLDEARAVEEQALSEIRATVTGYSSILVRALSSHCWTLHAMGDRAALEGILEELIDRVQGAAIRTAFVTSPRELDSFIGGLERYASTVMSFVRGVEPLDGFPQLERPALTMIETLRGCWAVFPRILAAQNRDPELGLALEELRQAHSQIAQQAFSDVNVENASSTASENRLSRAWTSLRMRLAKLGIDLGRDWSFDLDHHARSLKPDQAVVGYWAYPQRRRNEPSVDWLLAFVLRADGSLRMKDLGSLAAVDEAVEDWRQSSRDDDESGRGANRPSSTVDRPVRNDPERGIGSVKTKEEDSSPARQRAAGARLRQLVFDPLLPDLDGVQGITCLPAGSLNRAPLAFLPDGEGGLLSDRFHLKREIGLMQTRMVGQDDSLAEDLVAFGGIDYDAGPSEAEPEQGVAQLRPHGIEPAYRPHRYSVSVEPGESLFPGLPMSRNEVEALGKSYPDQLGKSRIVTGTEASKTALHRWARQARYLHLATHGWFAPQLERTKASDNESQEPDAPPPARDQEITRLSPLVWSGLALSGANQNGSGGLGAFPGIITAEEISGLDLSSCKLATMSACDTGEGVLRYGQGIASLQRALHLAGAEQVLVSLWKVNDADARDFMVKFYERHWAEGQTISAALRATQEEFRKAGKPFRAWAGWVLTGARDQAAAGTSSMPASSSVPDRSSCRRASSCAAGR